MLTMFAPMTVMPPSPKMTPCTRSTSVRTKTPAYGDPRTIAASAAPTMWPLVPQGMGMFNAWMAKMPAARTATSGIFSSPIERRAHRRARAMKIRAMTQ